ncbi:MAG TPA: S8 family peptidase [Thermoleophilaceae bacterium]|nr:S8 family peptidase [Thermoleophilaceae bacterium]
MPIRPLLLALAALVALLTPAATAAAGEYVPGEVVVKYDGGKNARVHEIRDGDSVPETIAELRANPRVKYAVPNHIARASQTFVPNDPGFRRQWNLSEPWGIGMPEAWSLAAASGAPAGKGVLIAVLDSGVAFERYKRYRRSPDLRKRTFVRGYDFIDRDRHPNDVFGHGTHVAGTIAQATNNREGAAGIAYEARIMPLRVLDSAGSGDSVAIAKAIRYAARRDADIINLSLEFELDVVPSEIPEILAAIRFAHRRGSLIVAAAGNGFGRKVAYPARADQVIAVGATTRSGCRSDYSNGGPDLDLVAPGGGVDAEPRASQELDLCNPNSASDWIFQVTFRGRSVQKFGMPRGYEGTSMAAPHVSGIAALVIASGKLGPNPSPDLVQNHIEATSRDLGRPGFDGRYGHGLVDAARALRCPPMMAC